MRSLAWGCNVNSQPTIILSVEPTVTSDAVGDSSPNNASEEFVENTPSDTMLAEGIKINGSRSGNKRRNDDETMEIVDETP